MNKKTEHLLLLASVGAAGLYFLSSSTPGVTSPVSAPLAASGNTGYPYPILPGAPPIPATWNLSYYLTYEYPAMLAANPNIGNPNYQLTQAEANQYFNNYLELQQWEVTVVPKPFANLLIAMQYHWHTYGVAQQYSFTPFLPTKNVNWTPPPVNKNASGSSTQSWIGTALSIATTVAAILSPPPVLNHAEAEVLINGSAIGLNILPMFYEATNGYASAAMGKMEDLLTQYTK